MQDLSVRICNAKALPFSKAFGIMACVNAEVQKNGTWMVIILNSPDDGLMILFEHI
jgi:hypothetical protein